MLSRVVILPLPALAAATPLEYIEAVTVVREVADRVIRGELPGVPSAHVIRLSETGMLLVEGPIAADGSDVRRAAQLLEALLAGPGSRRTPGALRLIIARALGSLDLPSYPSLASLSEALARFTAVDATECFQRIVSTRPGAVDIPTENASPTADLTITISDIRRARRATGASLAEISRRCDVPVHLLRQLEWGYLCNWPTSHVGRRLIAAYARAAGLDEQLVMGAVWPLLTESVLGRNGIPSQPLAPPDIIVEPEIVTDGPSGTLVRIDRVVPRTGAAMRRVVAVLTIPALLAIGAAPALWHAGAHRGLAVQITSPAAPVMTMPEPAGQPPAQETTVMIATPAPATGAPVRAVIVRQSLPHASQPDPVRVKRSPTSSRTAPARHRASRDKGPKKWGVWVLNKMGVRIVSTNPEEQNP